jgi:hypothetical protein
MIKCNKATQFMPVVKAFLTNELLLRKYTIT